MGRSHSKMKFPNNPLEKIEYNLKRRQQELEKRKKRHEKLKKELKKGKKFKHLSGGGSDVNEGDELSVKKCDLRIVDYDRIAINRLRNQLTVDFSSFVLNQLILSIQFYGHYEREKLEAIERNFRRESDKNRNLEKHSIILPNVLDDMVERRVQFKPKHGIFKNDSTALQLQTMYVVHENIEILKTDDTNYASISPTCKVVLDTNSLKTENWKGYVRLKLWELIKKKESKLIERKRKRRTVLKKTRGSQSSTSNDSDTDLSDERGDETLSSGSSYDESRNMNGCGPFLRSSSSTLTNPSSSEYDYAYITNLNTHRPLSLLTTTSYESSEASSSGVPGWCISGLPTYLDYNSSDTEEHIYSDYSSDKVKYLNSKAFLCYFAKQLKDKLAVDLAIPYKELEVATWRGSSIYTTNYEIIPAIFCPWPSCAFEWMRRQRPIHENPLTGQKFQWPNQAMVHRIVSFGCHVVPLGYAPKRGKNPFRELEWKIVFPKAERYLESCLTSTQIKVFMIAKVLVKTFLEPHQNKDAYMFSFEHLRTHLFWQCERNYAAWPEEYIGEVLIRFLRSFLDAISCKRLGDYFLPERNLFENIPERAQADLHQIIYQIVQNPVMHLTIAYRNIESLQNFFPKLHYKELYSIIVVDNPIQVINKSATSKKAHKVLRNIMKAEKKLSLDDYDSEDETDKLQGLIGYSQKREKFDETKRRRTKKLKKKERARIRKKLQNENAKRQSLDSIDLQFIVPECLEKVKRSQTKPQLRKTLDDLRKTFIVDLFVNFFIICAQNSYSYHAFDQSTIYLDQASRLCSILEEFPHQTDTVKQFLENIEQARETVKASIENETELGPELPRRISLEPVKSFQKTIRLYNGKIDPYANVEVVTVRQEKLKDEPTQRRPLSGRKSVQFTEMSFIEPRQFVATSAQIHSPPSNSEGQQNGIRVRTKLNGIIKQKSAEETMPAKDGNFVKFKSLDSERFKLKSSGLKSIKPEMKIAAADIHSDDEFYGDSTEL